MENLQFFLLTLQVIVACLLIILVLIQKSDGDSLSGIGGGSGGLNSVISSKSTASFLSKATMALIAFFMLNCLLLASIANNSNKSIQSDLKKIIEQQESNKSEDKTLQKDNSPKKPATPIIPSIE